MINMKPKQDTVSKFGNDCVDAVLLTPAIQYESKTLVWITATDKSKSRLKFILNGQYGDLSVNLTILMFNFIYRFWSSTQM